ncbi:MAG: response regulator, partial [Lachnospiraceae bacterium]|nr:response regulator [Lachnospiraceae bacterium]
MFKIAICDDEVFFRKWIKEMLQQYMRENGIYYEIETFQSGIELLELGIELNQFKIIFLDIEMDKMDGLVTAQKIREQNTKIFIVFVSAFANYSMEGYKVDAFRFLLKGNNNMQRHIAECMDAIRKKMEYDVIWKDFEFHEGKKKLSMDCLLYIESNLHKLLFYVMEEEILTYTLNDTLN